MPPSRAKVLNEIERARRALAAAASDLVDLSRAPWLDGAPPEPLWALMARVDDVWIALGGVLDDLRQLPGQTGGAEVIRVAFGRRPLVLLVDDDELVARSLERQLRSRFEVHVALSVAEARAALSARVPHAIVCDYELGLDTSVGLLEDVAQAHPGVRRVLYSASRPEVWNHLVDRKLVHRALMKPSSHDEIVAALGA